MLDQFMLIAEIIVILLLLFECWILWIFAREHTLLLDIMKHHLIEIRNELKKK